MSQATRKIIDKSIQYTAYRALDNGEKFAYISK